MWNVCRILRHATKVSLVILTESVCSDIMGIAGSKVLLIMKEILIQAIEIKFHLSN